MSLDTILPLATRLRQSKVIISLEENGALLVAFEAGLFQPNWSGQIEYRFGVAQGQAFLDKLREAKP